MVTEQDVSEYGCSFHSVVLVKCTKHVDDSCFSVCGISAANVRRTKFQSLLLLSPLVLKVRLHIMQKLVDNCIGRRPVRVCLCNFSSKYEIPCICYCSYTLLSCVPVNTAKVSILLYILYDSLLASFSSMVR